MTPVAEEYHQKPIHIEASSDSLWYLPITPLSKSPESSYLIEKAYHRHCALIQNHWGCSASECIPCEARVLTPYSFAMLVSLRHLAVVTQEDLPMARALMLQIWTTRTRKLSRAESPLHIVQTDCRRKKGQVFETHIHENLFGLMLADVAEAIRIASKRKVRRSRRARLELGILPSAQMTKKGAKRAEIRAKRMAKMTAFGTVDPQNVEYIGATHATLDATDQPEEDEAKIDPGTTASNDLQHGMQMNGDELVDVEFFVDNSGRDPDSRGEDLLHATLGDACPTTQDFRETPSYQRGLRDMSRGLIDRKSRPRYTGAKMTRMMDKMSFGVREGPNRRKRQIVRAGGFSRKEHQATRLPLERIGLDCLSELQHWTRSSDGLATTEQLDLQP